MPNLSAEPGDGHTWFLRCGACGALFVPAEGLDWTTGTMVVVWTRPRPRRKPAACTHTAVERWDGTQWVAARAHEAPVATEEAEQHEHLAHTAI